MSLSIAVAGISTILLLLLVVIVLFASALPLVSGTGINRIRPVDVPVYEVCGMDDRQILFWGLGVNGSIDVWDVGRSRKISTLAGFTEDGPRATCFYQAPVDNFIAVGFDDGTVRIANVEISDSLVGDNLSVDSSVVFSDKFGRTRQVRLEACEWSEPIQLAEQPIVELDWIRQSGDMDVLPNAVDQVLVAFKGEGEKGFVFFEISQGGMLVSEPTISDRQIIDIRWRSEQPARLMLSEGGEQAFVAWTNGVLDLLESRPDGWRVVESESIIGAGSALTVYEPAVSRRAMVFGTAAGEFVSWTMASRSGEMKGLRDSVAEGPSFGLVRNHLLRLADSAVLALEQGGGSSVAYGVTASDEIVAFNPTTESVLLRSKFAREIRKDLETRQEQTPKSQRELGGERARVLVSQDGRSVLASQGNRTSLIEVDLGGVEASWSTFFGRIWYEGYEAPSYVWQSASARDASQPKLSLIPLFLGSVKATLFAMLFSAPVGLMAAVYSSECLSSRWRERIRPLIETMAGIPGVIIGFIVAVIIGPIASDLMLYALVAAVLIPLTFYFCGRVFGLLQAESDHSAIRVRQNVALFATLLLAVFVTWLFGYVFEWAFFPDGFVEYLQSGRGSAFGGWLLVLLPILAFVVVGLKWWVGWEMGKRLSLIALHQSAGWRRLNDLAAIPAAVLLVFALGFGLASAFTGLEWDVRDGLLTGYQDRNALLVGFALGFCTIPVVYAMAEDALRVVPDSQRQAALACGATTWQSIVTVVLPSARSGLIAAVITGTGRVAGETMIVLMVVGNTPLIEWNPFSGLQSITATLATELPQAVIGSTHYRTLFLAALLLFLFTLAINTLAEVLRVRARRAISSY